MKIKSIIKKIFQELDDWDFTHKNYIVISRKGKGFDYYITDGSGSGNGYNEDNDTYTMYVSGDSQLNCFNQYDFMIDMFSFFGKNEQKEAQDCRNIACSI